MATFTREQKKRQVQLWQTALELCSSGEEYTIGSRRLRMSDLPEIRATLDWLESKATVEDERAGLSGPHHTMMVPGRGGRGGY